MTRLATRAMVAIVDDDEAVRDSTRLLLEVSGFAAQCYESGTHLLLDDLDQFDFLLIDYHLPGMTGLDILGRLRRLKWQMPAALMTGSSSPDIRRRALELGAVQVFNKPLDAEELIAIIICAVS